MIGSPALNLRLSPHLPDGRGSGGVRVRLLCVDDNEMLGRALGRFLSGQPRFEWLGAITDAEAVFEAAARLNPDIVLMDIDMPGFDTFDIVRRLAEAQPHSKTVMLSGHVDAVYLARALDSGAWGYLSKAEEADVLVDAILRANEGEIVLGKEVEILQRSIDRR